MSTLSPSRHSITSGLCVIFALPSLRTWRKPSSVLSSERGLITPTLFWLAYHWLPNVPIHQRIQFKIACITYKTIHTTQPAYLNSVLEHYTPARTLRSSDTNPWGALQGGPGGPWPSQNFGWVGHNAFVPTNNWPVCSLILLCGQLILRKISKIGASRYQILRLKCTKFTFCWGCAPDPAGAQPQQKVNYSAPRPYEAEVFRTSYWTSSSLFTKTHLSEFVWESSCQTHSQQLPV